MTLAQMTCAAGTLSVLHASVGALEAALNQVPTIKKLISSLSYAKINVLHCEWRCSFD